MRVMGPDAGVMGFGVQRLIQGLCDRFKSHGIQIQESWGSDSRVMGFRFKGCGVVGFRFKRYGIQIQESWVSDSRVMGFRFERHGDQIQELWDSDSRDMGFRFKSYRVQIQEL